MTDSLLRYLVTVLLRPGERCTYEDFLEKLYLHYGIAVEGEALTDSLSGAISRRSAGKRCLAYRDVAGRRFSDRIIRCLLHSM